MDGRFLTALGGPIMGQNIRTQELVHVLLAVFRYNVDTTILKSGRVGAPAPPIINARD
jgi:hypothetical protein